MHLYYGYVQYEYDINVKLSIAYVDGMFCVHIYSPSTCTFCISNYLETISLILS